MITFVGKRRIVLQKKMHILISPLIMYYAFALLIQMTQILFLIKYILLYSTYYYYILSLKCVIGKFDKKSRGVNMILQCCNTVSNLVKSYQICHEFFMNDKILPIWYILLYHIWFYFLHHSKIISIWPFRHTHLKHIVINEFYFGQK